MDRLVRRQHGVFSFDQALEVGFTPASISRQARSGAWVRLAPGVYAVSSSVLTMHRQYKAAQLSAPGAAVAELAAAALHGIPGFRTVRPEITVPPGTSARNLIATVHRWTVPPKLVTVKGILATSIAQTLLDIAPRIDELRLERAMDDSLLTNRVKIAQFEERLVAFEGTRRQGLVLYRDLIAERQEDGYEPPESELEARLLGFVRQVPALGRVIVQPALPWLGRRRRRADLLLPDVGSLLEGDGRRWHARVRDFDADRERDNETVLHGLRPLRFTWRHLTTRQLMVLDQLHRLASRPAA